MQTQELDIRRLIDGLRQELTAPAEGMLRVEEVCRKVEELNRGKKGVPKFLRPFFRNQGRLNDQLLIAVRLLLQLREQDAQRQKRELDEVKRQLAELLARA